MEGERQLGYPCALVRRFTLAITSQPGATADHWLNRSAQQSYAHPKPLRRPRNRTASCHRAGPRRHFRVPALDAAAVRWNLQQTPLAEVDGAERGDVSDTEVLTGDIAVIG